MKDLKFFTQRVETKVNIKERDEEMANKIAKEVFRQSLIDEFKANKAVYGITNEMIGQRINLDRKTIGKKLLNPELFTLWEIQIVVEYLRIKPTTLSAFIYGDSYVSSRN